MNLNPVLVISFAFTLIFQSKSNAEITPVEINLPSGLHYAGGWQEGRPAGIGTLTLPKQEDGKKSKSALCEVKRVTGYWTPIRELEGRNTPKPAIQHATVEFQDKWQPLIEKFEGSIRYIVREGSKNSPFYLGKCFLPAEGDLIGSKGVFRGSYGNAHFVRRPTKGDATKTYGPFVLVRDGKLVESGFMIAGERTTENAFYEYWDNLLVEFYADEKKAFESSSRSRKAIANRVRKEQAEYENRRRQEREEENRRNREFARAILNHQSWTVDSNAGKSQFTDYAFNRRASEPSSAQSNSYQTNTSSNHFRPSSGSTFRLCSQPQILMPPEEYQGVVLGVRYADESTCAIDKQRYNLSSLQQARATLTERISAHKSKRQSRDNYQQGVNIAPSSFRDEDFGRRGNGDKVEHTPSRGVEM